MNSHVRSQTFNQLLAAIKKEQLVNLKKSRPKLKVFSSVTSRCFIRKYEMHKTAGYFIDGRSKLLLCKRLGYIRQSYIF